MTNEQKAKELTNEQKAKKIVDSIFSSGFNTYRTFYEMAYNSVMEMAKWKDEQYAKVFAKLIVELDELKHQIKSLLP